MPSQTNFPAPGTVLWGLDVDLARDVFRSGATSKPSVEYLRFTDLNISTREGRIPDEETDQFTVNPGQGISLFLERMIPQGMVLMDAATWKAQDKRAQRKIHWWGIDQRHPIPARLTLVYDGVPPGHCTLTVTESLTVKSFLALVAQVPFTFQGTDLVGPTYT